MKTDYRYKDKASFGWAGTLVKHAIPYAFVAAATWGMAIHYVISPLADLLGEDRSKILLEYVYACRLPKPFGDDTKCSTIPQLELYEVLFDTLTVKPLSRNDKIVLQEQIEGAMALAGKATPVAHAEGEAPPEAIGRPKK